MQVDDTLTFINSSVDAVAFAVHLGHPKPGTLGSQSASNALIMTGGSLTTQGNFLLNVGRGRNADPNHVVQFIMSGGVINAAGIVVPEAFDPDNVPGFRSLGLNAEMVVSGDSVVNTDLLRLGANDANSLVELSENAQMNLTDDNNGFANGTLWIEAFEDPMDTGGTSVLDIRDNAVLTIHGEWWTNEGGDVDGSGNPIRGAATQTELEYYQEKYIAIGWITANGGDDPVWATFADGVITMRAVPEPSLRALLAFSVPWLALCRTARGRRGSSVADRCFKRRWG